MDVALLCRLVNAPSLLKAILNILLEEMSDRVDTLRNECPSDWSPIKNEIDEGSIDMRGKYEETMEYIGKASPVSIPG